MKYVSRQMIGAGLGAALLLAGPAQAAPTSDWYTGLSGDLTWLRHSDMGGGGNIAIGYRSAMADASALRLEGEFGYHDASGSDGYGDTNYYSYLANAYYDFNSMFSSSSSGWHVAPYVGAGLGAATVNYGDTPTAASHTSTKFAWDAMAGLSLTSASMPVDWSLGYRYLDTTGESIHAHNLELGARFHF